MSSRASCFCVFWAPTPWPGHGLAPPWPGAGVVPARRQCRPEGLVPWHQPSGAASGRGPLGRRGTADVDRRAPPQHVKQGPIALAGRLGSSLMDPFLLRISHARPACTSFRLLHVPRRAAAARGVIASGIGPPLHHYPTTMVNRYSRARNIGYIRDLFVRLYPGFGTLRSSTAAEQLFLSRICDGTNLEGSREGWRGLRSCRFWAVC